MRHEEQLNDLAAHEIAALEADGIKPTAAEIVQLNALGWAVETPCARIALAKGYHVEAGGCPLWPLTLWAADWLERVASKMPDAMYGAALAYAMAHGYSDGDELDADGEKAENAVRKWRGKLRCTAKELIEAIEQVQAQDAEHDLPEDPDYEDHAGMTRGDYSAFLSAATSQPFEFWERRCAQSYTFAVLHSIIRQKLADGKPVDGDPKIKATIALGLAVEKIRERVKPAEEVNG